MAVDLNRIRALSDAMRERVGQVRSAPARPLDLARVHFAGILDYDPFQLRDPNTGKWVDTGVPKRAKKFMRSINHVVDLAKAVEEIRADDSSIDWHVLSGGASGAGVRMAVLPDGRRVVHKRAANWEDPADAKAYADADQLASLVGLVLGSKVAGVYRDEDDGVWIEHVPGQTRGAAEGFHDRDANDAYADWFGREDGGMRQGFLDALIGNSDRNDGNAIITPEGDVVGIDHAYAFQMLGSYHGTPSADDLGSPDGKPMEYYVEQRGTLETTQHFVSNPLTNADIAVARERLEALRPDFNKLGRGAWLDNSLAILAQLAEHATGSENVIDDA